MNLRLCLAWLDVSLFLGRLIAVSDAQALAEIQRLAQLDRIRYSHHARDRMAERGAMPADVRCALVTATAAVWQAERSNWRVRGGVDRAGDELTAVVDLEADVIVVTIF